MRRLVVHVEGQTEEEFVNEILRPHLLAFKIHVYPRIAGNGRIRRGGIRPWPSARDGIIRHLQEDSGGFATTLVDFYGLPKGWPGRSQVNGPDAPSKAAVVENAILQDVAGRMGWGDHNVRFIPFVMMHEFEALLFSDCEAFSRAMDQPRLHLAFENIRSIFTTPEEINDSPDSAPSKRIQAAYPAYQKPLLGNLAALEIGLDRMRAQCPHFNEWITKLERL